MPSQPTTLLGTDSNITKDSLLRNQETLDREEKSILAKIAELQQERAILKHVLAKLKTARE